MKRAWRVVLTLALAGSATLARSAFAQVVTGTVTPAYGAPLITQTTQTDWYDALNGDAAHCDGSELDGAYAYIDAGVLHLFLTGNLFNWTSGINPVSLYDNLELFVDCAPGGQNTLRSDNAAVGTPQTVNALAGLSFDADFAADHWFGFHGLGLFGSPPNGIVAYHAALLSGGGGSGEYLGQGTTGGPGTLSGGTNPYGIRVTMNESNRAGVTAGCGASSGAGVTTGIEWAIPLAALGNPTGCMKICAFVDYQEIGFLVTNQVLGPLPPGTCNLGTPAGVNFDSIPGTQSFVVCTGVVPVSGTSWGRLKTLYR